MYAAGEGHDSSGAAADAPTFTRRTGGNTADSERSVEEKNHTVKPQSGGMARSEISEEDYMADLEGREIAKAHRLVKETADTGMPKTS